MSTVRVKVKTSVLISHLEKGLAERHARYKNRGREQAEYDKAIEAYNRAVVKLVRAGKVEVGEASRLAYYDRSKERGNKIGFNVVVLLPAGSLPEEPEAPETYQDYEYRREVEEISQAIRVLRLTDDQTVSASTYNSVAKYL